MTRPEHPKEIISAGQGSDGYFQRSLAPAPLLVFAATIVIVTLALGLASLRIDNDWIAAFVGVVILSMGWAVLDVSGRARAATNPHDLYVAQRLPTGTSKLKRLLIGSTLLLLVVVVGATAEPGEGSSPYPYFMAVLLIALVYPQLLARRAVRRHDRRRLNPTG